MTQLPAIPPPDWDNIPAALKAAGPYWVCFRAPAKRRADGTVKREKLPVDPKTGRAASSKQPDTWGTYEQAKAYYEAHSEAAGGKIAGVGIELRPELGVVGIDFDHVIDTNGECQDDAWKAVLALNSYTELSPSGDGLHVFVRGGLKISSEKYPTGLPFAVELFADKFFLTVTGNRAAELPDDVEPRQQELNDLFARCEATRQSKVLDTEAPAEFADLDAFEATILPKLAALDPGPRRAHTGEAGHTGFLWEVLCPWRDEHTGGNDRAGVFFYPGGHRPGFSCFHAHCRDRAWAEFAEKMQLPLPSWLDEFNATYAVANLSGKTVILHETVEPVMDRPIVEYQEVSAFHNFHANRTRSYKSGGRTVEVNLSREWFRHPARRQYDGVVFDPSGRAHPGRFNLWRGWSVVPQPGDWSLMQAHIRDVICTADEGHYEYLLDWLADLVQDPGERPGVAVALRGSQGAGKGIFAREVGAIMRAHYVHLSAGHQLTGHFNSHLAAALLIFADEAIFAADRSQEGHLKALITEDVMLVTPKGVNSFPLRNFSRLLMATNSSWIAPVGMDDRRYFVLDVDSKFARNAAYFAALLDQQRNGGRAAMLHDLLARPYDKAALRRAPTTGAGIEQKIHSLNSVERYWAECLDIGAHMLADAEHEWVSRDTWQAEVKRDELYHGYCRFCTDARERHPRGRIVFFRELMRIWPNRASIRETRTTLSSPDLQTARDEFSIRLTGRPDGIPF